MMRPKQTKLLVSVRSAEEAEATVANGADLIDVKEPSRGSLGRADDTVLAAVIRSVAGRRPVSTALGELRDGRVNRARSASEEEAFILACAAGSDTPLAFVKWGLAGCHPHHDWRGDLEMLTAEMSRNGPMVVPVAYADWELAQAPPIWEVVDFAGRRPGGVLLIDTSDKTVGRTLLDWLPRKELAALCQRCRSLSLRIAIAGSLGFAEISQLADLQPDWFAVRGAVCTAGRSSPISAAKVYRLARLLHHCDPVAKCES
jgi:uncharacterized protein (UPF0264 family)